MTETRISKEFILSHFNAINEQKLLNKDDNAFVFYDFDILANRIELVKSAFGPTFSHSIAVKSNPLKKIIQYIGSKGFGQECASFEEVMLSNNEHFNSFIIWDSPAKTLEELKASDSVSNLLINANDLVELERILIETKNSEIGLRVNPQISSTAFQSMNVSSIHSKFGESLSSEIEIIETIIKSPDRLNTLHVHTSSQNIEFDKQISAVKSVINLANQINSLKPNKIKRIDIGGGFPASYYENIDYSMNEYVDSLKNSCPSLFDGTFKGLTEFGRYYHANAGIAFSKIESVKYFDNHQTIIEHLGADMFLRECYNPDQWPHEYFVIRKNQFNIAKKIATDIGGPLCFGGDYLAKNALVEKSIPGDFLVIMDVGANSFSLWSRHCSRPFPKVIGHENNGYSVIKEKESLEDIIKFWS